MGDRRNSEAVNNSPSKYCSHCCKLSDTDQTNTSELKASRQVISLLQRQLELERKEREILERLLLAQTDNTQSQETSKQVSNLIELSASPSKKSTNPTHDLQDAIYGEERSSTNLHRFGSEFEQDLSDNQKRLLQLIKNQIYEKEEELVKLNTKLNEITRDNERLQSKLSNLELRNDKQESEILVLKENLDLRDKTIKSLSDEIFDQGTRYPENYNGQENEATSTSPGQQLLKALRNVAKLTETLDAYKKTNELLTNNVIKLTDRCTALEKSEMDSKSDCQELEAKCCQIQSKLLSLLKEIEQSTQPSEDDNGNDKICIEPVKLLIKRLLEDKSLDIPLSWKEGNKSSRKQQTTSGNQANKDLKKYECDELGFYFVTIMEKNNFNDSDPGFRISYNLKEADGLSREGEEEREHRQHGEEDYSTVENLHEEDYDEPSPKMARENLKRSILRKLSIDANKKDEVNWRSTWDNFIKNFDNIDLKKSTDFKNLLRTGVPQDYRCKVWKTLVELRIGEERKQLGTNYYQSLLEPNRPKGKVKKTNPWIKPIELDLLRTLPNNKHFEAIDSSGTTRLRKVLVAYSEHNPKVGYCQGMNRLAAVALLVLPEEEAFWCLVAIVDKIMPNGYYNNLWLAQVDSSVVMDLIASKLSSLSEKFKRCDVELSLFAWFLTIYVDGTPAALFLRLWDCFLYEGDKVLFRAALALLFMFESELMKLNNSVAVNNFLRSKMNSLVDLDDFFDVAFTHVNPLSGRTIRDKRRIHTERIRSDIESLNSFYSARDSSSATEQSSRPSDSNCNDNDNNESDANDKDKDKDKYIEDAQEDQLQDSRVIRV